MGKMIVGVMILVVATTGIPTASEATETTLHVRAVRQLLRNRTTFPKRRNFLRTGKAVKTMRILMQIASNRTEKPVLRLNAIRALEYFPRVETKGSLMSILFTRHQKAAYKRACLRSLARAFGSSTFFELLPFLQDIHPRVRGGAALAIGEIDDPRVETILINHLVHEKEMSVRLSIERALKWVRLRKLKQRLKKRAK